jgi:hypothetical protein
MKYIISTLLVICIPIFVFCQDITGLWKGTMFNDSTQQSLEYEIFISKNKGKYTGFSHTWFLIDEKKYYGVKKINVRIAKDGKVILQDAELIGNNYPVLPYKDVLQLNVLDLANPGDDAKLDGLFVTNRTKFHKEITGHISVKKVSQFSQSDLLSYLEKNSRDIYVAVLK